MEERYFRADIDLAETFLSGQTFLWDETEDGFASYLRGGAQVRQTPDGFAVAPCGEADIPFWRNYFDLDSDYPSLLAPVMDEPLALAVRACPGLRLLRQPFFETLCAFISSAHNSIPRISSIMHGLRALSPAGGFPTPSEVAAAGVEGLKRAGMGFRAERLYKSACMVLEGMDETSFVGLPYEEALQRMLRFPGVGEKVADCVLLFALGYREAFPVDVWMLRAMERLYGLTGTPAQVKRASRERFGKEAGLAQLYLFHAVRLGRLGQGLTEGACLS